MEPGQYSGGAHLEDRDLVRSLLLGSRGLSYEDDEFYATSVMSTLFSGGMSSRLFKKSVKNAVWSIRSIVTPPFTAIAGCLVLRGGP